MKRTASNSGMDDTHKKNDNNSSIDNSGFKVPRHPTESSTLRKPRLSQLRASQEAAARRRDIIASTTNMEDEVELLDKLLSEQNVFKEFKSDGYSSDYSQFLDYVNYRKLLLSQQEDTADKSRYLSNGSHTPRKHFFDTPRGRSMASTPVDRMRTSSAASLTSRNESPMSIVSSASSLKSVGTYHAPPPKTTLSREQEWIRKLRKKIDDAMKISVDIKDVPTPTFELLSTAAKKRDEALAPKTNFPPLTSDMMKTIQSSLKASSGLVLVTKFNLDIKSPDICTLKDRTWLNDMVINFYGNLLLERSQNNSNLPKIHFFNSFFYTQLKKEGYTKVRRWTKKFNLFEKDLVIFPVHLGSHWCCGVIDLRQKSIEYYDSMHGLDRPFFGTMRTYLQEESKDKLKTEFDLTGWQDLCPRNIPAQENGYDCGVFTTMFGEYRSRDEPFDFSQEHMKYFRQRMIYEIITGKLLVP